MRYLRLTLAYDGTNYEGWQFQPDKPTLQGTIEQALAQITGEFIRVTGSSRTDAGVHALGQVASFRTSSSLPANVLQRALNATLPSDVVVVAAEDAPADFHAIRDTISKRYRYLLHNHRLRDVFSPRHAWHVWHPLDLEAMCTASCDLLGRHDFAAFQSTGSDRVSTVRTVTDLTIERGSDHRIVIEIEADGFLYNMVRAIVGSLVAIGRGKHPATWLRDVLISRDRTQAGVTAPPHGLYLLRVVTGHPSERRPSLDAESEGESP